MTACFLQPLDLLYLRGNHLFGDAGSFGAALMPPWPSVFAGALRSHLLSSTGTDLAAFARGDVNHPVLGTPAHPGSFGVTAVHLARRHRDGVVERFYPIPADAIVLNDDPKPVGLHLLKPSAWPLPSSYPLALMPLLQAPQAKPAAGYFLREAAWREYLHQRPIKSDWLIPASKLWASDSRVGIGLDSVSRAAADGALYTAQAVAMIVTGEYCSGFAVDLVGLPDGMTPGTIRLGGDGRGAALQPLGASKPIEPDYAAIVKARRCRIVLTSPGIFPAGWKLPGLTDDNAWSLGAANGRLVSASVARAETVSGWDLAKRKPKAAERAAPVGSVYWLDQLDADEATLRSLVQRGLWSDADEDRVRRAEGFNRFSFAQWT